MSSVLERFESVIAPKTAHINVHEAGGPEAAGIKIDAVENRDGKIEPEQILKVIEDTMPIHMTKPGAVFISDSTEVGTIYSKQELTAISKLCRESGLVLYLDGARLGSALTSSQNDLTLQDITELVDVFYIGGTKNGAAIGEAVIINNKRISENFGYFLKRNGALLARGRLIASEFIALFENDLYFDLASHANTMAGKLSKGISKLGYKFLTNSPTNQIFPIFPNQQITKLEKMYGFYVWEKVDKDSSAVRLVTSWATPEEKVDEFLKDLQTV